MEGRLSRYVSAGSLGSEADRRALLMPAMHDPVRVGSRSSSVFNLVATLVGGGCLSLPFAFHKTGLALGPLYLLFSGLLSGFSMRLLLSCSRRTGAQTYEECGEKAFGRKMKYVTMVLLIMVTFLAAVAYLILARDLATPLVESYIVGAKTSQNEHNFIAIMFLLPVVPLCYAKSLHALRFTSMVSLCALGVLTGAIIYRSVDRAHERKIDWDDIELASLNGENTIYALPFMELSFMAHFNLLPIHTGMRKPTRARLDQVVSYTIGLAYTFYILISIAGYLYAYDHVCGKSSSSTCEDGVPDNILNAFDLNDSLIDIGRLGFLSVILLSFPLLVMPCRETIISLLKQVYYHENPGIGDDDDDFDIPYSSFEGQVGDGGELGNDHEQLVEDGGEVPTLGRGHRLMSDCADSPEFGTPHIRRQQRALARQESATIDIHSKEGRMHVIITSTLVVLVVVSMALIPGVAVVWNITGSTVAMLLSFVFPAVFYIKVRAPTAFFAQPLRDSRMASAWALLLASLLTTALCTVESFNHLFSSSV